MTCEELKALVVTNPTEATPSMIVAFGIHYNNCESCRAFLEQYNDGEPGSESEEAVLDDIVERAVLHFHTDPECGAELKET